MSKNHFCANILILNGEFEESLAVSKRYSQMPNATGYWKWGTMASALGNLGRIDEVLPIGWCHGDRYSAAQWVGPERYA